MICNLEISVQFWEEARNIKFPGVYKTRWSPNRVFAQQYASFFGLELSIGKEYVMLFSEFGSSPKASSPLQNGVN